VTRLRHTDELVGLFVLLAVLVLVGAILEEGFLGRWFQPTSTLRILLPESGVGGLVAGDDVQVLGTHAGTVRRIVINLPQRMYAVAEIDDQVRAIIPRDSTAVIRREFGIAGAAYVDIQRGTGAPMDWNYAVIEATNERATTDSVNALIDETREKIYPVLTDAGRVAHSLAAITERIERGEGNIGHVLVDDALSRNADAVVASANDNMKTLGQLLTRLDKASADIGALVRTTREGKSGLPALLRQMDQILADVHGATRDLGRAMTRAPTLARNVEETTENMPALLLQTQATAEQLEKLLIQLRGSWLLGGGTVEPETLRVAPTQARP
jgi:phospholipid/cholesterol/gamma-HCH transport system substrate-binding protein